MSLHFNNTHRHGELGYWVGVPWWRVGYATEAAKALTLRLSPGVDPDALFGGEGYFRTSPALHHTDGFFAAVLDSADRVSMTNRARLLAGGPDR